MRAVLFDLDGTLTDRPASIKSYARRLHADLASSLREVQAEKVAAVILAADQCGYAPREAVFRAVVQALPWHQAPELALLQAHWDEWYPASTIAAAGALTTLKALHDKGLRLGVVSNGSVKRQEPKIDVLGLRDLLGVVVISEAAGVKKPDPKIFAIATRALGCENRDVWFVGDHPANDIHGATQSGLRAIWVRGLHDWPSVLPKALHTVDALPAVVGIVSPRLSPR